MVTWSSYFSVATLPARFIRGPDAARATRPERLLVELESWSRATPPNSLASKAPLPIRKASRSQLVAGFSYQRQVRLQ